MKRSFLVIILFCLVAQISEAQLWKMKRWEIQFGTGPSFFFGDIGGFSRSKNLLGFKDISYRQTMFDINTSLKYRLSRTFNTKLSLSYGFLHGVDLRGSNENRAFEASTSIFEPALIWEYYFIKNRYESSYLFLKGKGFWTMLSSLDFYLFAGIGGVNYSVRGNDALVNHGMKTGGFSTVIPGGIGATLIYSPNFNFGVELGGRYAFTDYLDGYTSQYSSANDVYYFLNFTVTYKLKSSPSGLPSFR
jgi:hypothetical protein